VEIQLTKGLAAHINKISDPIVRELIALVVATTIAKRKFEVHSEIIKRVVGSHRYSDYLAEMKALPFIERNDSYLTKRDAQDHGTQPFCKAWRYNGLRQAYRIGNINALVCRGSVLRRGFVRWDFCSVFRKRIAAAFEWFKLERGGLGDASREVFGIVGRSLADIEVPDLTFEDVLDICGGEHVKAVSNWNALMALRRGSDAGCRFGFGHRLYHRMTNLKKEIRRMVRMNGSPTVEVDMHATFPCIIASRFAPPGERERLVTMCQSGDFYGEMARLLGMQRGDLKKGFQKEVVFAFRPHWSHAWRAFEREFPGTAQKLSDIRDRSNTVVSERYAYDVNRQRYLKKTRSGQRRLSRILERVESRIFIQRALVRLHRIHGISAVPIHDSLMVEEQFAEVAQQFIEQAAKDVLGFTPVVKISDAAVCRDTRVAVG
jgi:hypothetical protein